MNSKSLVGAIHESPAKTNGFVRAKNNTKSLPLEGKVSGESLTDEV